MLLTIAAWYAYQHDFFEGTHFDNSMAVLSYIYDWCAYYGVFHPNIVSNPPLAVHGAEILLFVTSVVYAIAFCMQPPHVDPNAPTFKIRAFVALERSLPEPETFVNTRSAATIRDKNRTLNSLRQHLVEGDYKRFMNLYLPKVLNQRSQQHFCIESALILLEISYQTYFSVGSDHPASASNTVSSNQNTAKALAASAPNKVSAITAGTFEAPSRSVGEVVRSAANSALPGVVNASTKSGFGRYNTNNTNNSTNNNSMNSDGYNTALSPINTINTISSSANGDISSPVFSTNSVKSTNPFEELKNPFEEPKNPFEELKNPFEEPKNPFDNDEEDVEEDKVTVNSFEDANNPFELEEKEVEPHVPAPILADLVSTAAAEKPANPFDTSLDDIPPLEMEIDTNALVRAEQNPFVLALPASASTAVAKNPFDDDNDNDEEDEGAHHLSSGNNHSKHGHQDHTSSDGSSISSPYTPLTLTPPRPEPESPEIKISENAAPKQAAPETGIPSQTVASENIEGLNYGPKLNLSGMGYKLRSTFSCDKYTTFGFLCESEGATVNSRKLVVSFRGSVLGNAVSNLKIAQVALPTLKRPRSYFTHLIREFNSSQKDLLQRGELTPSRYSAYNDFNYEYSPRRRDSLDSDDREVDVIEDSDDLNFDLDRSMSQDYSSLLEQMESGENDSDFKPPDATMSAAQHIKDSKIAENIRSVGKNIPILNQGFKRVHKGFWSSYSSIREDFMVAVVRAMYEHRQSVLRSMQEKASVSPAHR